MAILWKDEYSVGIESIDAQHKKFIALINALSDGFLSGKSREELQEILSGLEAYANEHFTYEEKYFLEFYYPASKEHITEHNQYTKRVDELQRRLSDKSQDIHLFSDMFLFMEKWLTHHIVGSDKKYARLFLRNGLK